VAQNTVPPETKLAITLFVWTYQQNQQPSNSVFLSQQTSKQYFQHNKPAKRTGHMVAQNTVPPETKLAMQQNLHELFQQMSCSDVLLSSTTHRNNFFELQVDSFTYDTLLPLHCFPQLYEYWKLQFGLCLQQA
jgi:hypothetical protein